MPRQRGEAGGETEDGVPERRLAAEEQADRPAVLQMCYTALVPNSVTSSFRVSDSLRLRLEATARQLGKRKNWVINRALEEYLTKTHRASLAKEARRQSLVASRVTTADERFWMDKAAAEDWK